MRTEPVLRVYHLVAVDDEALLVSRNQVLLVVAPGHSLHSVHMHITTVLEFKVLCVPDDNLARTRAADYFLSVLHPLYLVQGLSVFVLALAKIVGCNNVLPVSIISLPSS